MSLPSMSDAPFLRVSPGFLPCPTQFHVIWNGMWDWRVVRSDIRAQSWSWITWPIPHRFITEKAANQMRDALSDLVSDAWIDAQASASARKDGASPNTNGASQ